MQEIWKTVITEDGIYENYKVSNLGKIKSLGNDKTRKEKILKQYKNKYGYLCINLYKNNKKKIYTVHRLTAYAFIPNVMSYQCIDHRDTNKQNNSILNLVWVTYKQNMNNELTKTKRKGIQFSEETKKKMSESQKGNTNMLGKHHSEETKKKMSENNGKSKKVLCIEIGEIFASTMEASRQLNINNNNISSVCRKERKQAGKLTFRYLDQVLFYN